MILANSETLRQFSWSSLKLEPQTIADELIDRHGIGAVKITAPPHTEDLNVLKEELFEWSRVLGYPILIYKNKGLWKHIGVLLDIDVDRTGGVGDIPLHIDLVNASMPPEFVIFLCEKGAGPHGGQSTVGAFRRALQFLGSNTIDELSQVLVKEGRFFDLENVGSEKNPFPLLEWNRDRVEWVRYTGKTGAEIIQGSRHAVRLLDEAMCRATVQFELRRGEAFIVNQKLAAHGRRSLGVGQSISSEVMQRSLWQLFVRGDSHKVSKCFVYPA